MRQSQSLALKHRAAPLAGMIALLLAAYPLLPDGLAGDLVMAGLITLLVLAGIVSLAGDRMTTAAALALGLLPVTVHLFTAVAIRGDAVAELWSAAAAIPFFLLVAWHSLRYAARHALQTNDRLIAAASAYLLVGFAWSGVHALVYLLEPTSYTIAGADHPDWGAFLYFSFVTLTTLGYGDVTPRTEPAQAAATLEAIFGVFFLGFLVARMLALYPDEESRPNGGSVKTEVSS